MPTRLTSRVWAPGAAAVAALLLAAILLAEIPDATRFLSGGRTGTVLVVGIGLAFVVIGVVAWLQRPENRTGALLAAFGLAALCADLTVSDSPLLYLLGQLADSPVLAVFLPRRRSSSCRPSSSCPPPSCSA